MPETSERPRGFGARLHRLVVPSRHNAYHPHLIGHEGLAAIFAIVLVVEGLWAVAAFVERSGAQFLAAVEPAAVLALTNSERAQSDIAPLADNAKLDAAAQAKADDMAAKGYFSHVSPDGTEPWAWISQAGYRYSYAGENLAVRFSESGDVVNAWMASPAHRANLLKPEYRDEGVGVAQGTYQGTAATFVVQFFGAPEEAAAAAAVPQQHLAAAPAASSAKAAPAGAVEGASTVAPANSLKPGDTSFARRVVETLAVYREAAFWFFFALAILLVIAIAHTLAAHTRAQRQPRHRLLMGALAMCFFSIACATLDLNAPAFTATSRESAASVELGAGGPPVSLQVMIATSTAR